MSYYIERHEPSRMPEWYEENVASMYSIRSILVRTPGKHLRADVVTNVYGVQEVKGDRAGTNIMEADERLLRCRVYDLKGTHGVTVENLTLEVLGEQIKLFSALGKGRPCILANRTATSLLKDRHLNDIYRVNDPEQYREILGCPFFTAKGLFNDSCMSIVVLVADQSITYSDDLPEDFEYDVELAGVRHFRFGPGLVELARDSLRGLGYARTHLTHAAARELEPSLDDHVNNLRWTTSAAHHVAFSARPVGDAPVWKLYHRA